MAGVSLSRMIQRGLLWFFGALFVYAGWLKARDPGVFLIGIRSYQMLPDPFAAWLSLMLPWVEIFAGLAVITGWLRRGGLLILNGMLVVFAIVLSLAWFRGLDIDCGCFGGGGKTTLVEGMIRDVALLALGAWLWRMDRRR